MSFEDIFATRTSRMGASVIREILKMIAQPGMVSLAGGIPAPESFPLDVIDNLTSRVISKYGSRAFQYDLTEGFIPLREALVDYLKSKYIQASVDEILVSSGSQGALDSLGKILISPGDKVAVEAPTYLGAIQAFNPYNPDYVRMDTDDDGLVPDSLEKILSTDKIKFIYVIPTFQNPTGRTTTLERREKIAGIVQKYNTLVIEDDPYSVLRFRGEEIPSIKSLAPDHVVYMGTLSKVLAPGLRIGFCIAPKTIRDWLVLAKQGVDLHTSTFNQALAAEYISGNHLNEQLPKIINLYRPRQEAMLNALEKYFPSSFSWSKPDGGMFIWAVGPDGIDMEKINEKCIDRKTAFVPGKFFFTQKGEGNETMRLNYTMTNETAIDKAIKTIAEVIRSGE